MNNFTYTNPTVIQFGRGQIASIAGLIAPDHKVLLVYGGGSIKRNGIYDQVTAALGKHAWIEFSGVEPNPCVETLDKAVELARREKVTFILAVGGGSVIDGCKYIAAAVCHTGDAWDIVAGRHIVTNALPIGAVLTIPATGSESNSGAVVSRADTHEKCVFRSPLFFPQFAVLDPDVVKSLPERQLANGIADAFVHVCEQYITYPCGGMVQDGYSEALLRTLVSLTAQFADRDNDTWRGNLMWAANQALNGLIGAGMPRDFATHMIGHELTAMFGMDHARTLAVVQPQLLRHQMDNKREKLEQMGRNVFMLTEGMQDGFDLAERTVQATERLYHSLGISTRLADYGVTDSAFIETVIRNLKNHGLEALGERGAVTQDVCRRILADAM
ncbi:iron-containing alcohol dehydrogenase [Desulfovibrio subterraneus]|uniref:iron-containing alcohol dehydrogenase n=1 Tax=Desulfovibrio subterraneus TaxID=2718620 RepID=UPI0022B8B66D|nr:iron-containing alcohol dehydrogenase [Desulfovibrio subterraneus]WBF69173.1 iron-containing alcohol dehydrogenase [Desulfovibrio subterraneus]